MGSVNERGGEKYTKQNRAMDEEMFRAARDGKIAGVRAALCAGANPNATWKGQTALMYACEKGQDDIANLLLDNGAKINAVDNYRRTALHLAVMGSHVACCRTLIQRGASIDIEADFLGGETPLDIAKLRSSTELQRILNLAKVVKPDVAPTLDGVPSLLAAPAAMVVKSAAVVDAVRTAYRVQHEEDYVAPTAMTAPRRAPAAEMDELRIHKPLPKAEM